MYNGFTGENTSLVHKLALVRLCVVYTVGRAERNLHLDTAPSCPWPNPKK